MGYRSIPVVFFDHCVDEMVWEQYFAQLQFEEPDEHCWPWSLEPDVMDMRGGICHFYKNWREERGLLVDGPEAQTPTIDKPAPVIATKASSSPSPSPTASKQSAPSPGPSNRFRSERAARKQPASKPGPSSRVTSSGQSSQKSTAAPGTQEPVLLSQRQVLNPTASHWGRGSTRGR
ncbi:hypothetical protein FOYG_11637 [Fusarium oxysporum NRRL 32931]|uniref:Uncharacterized protein n=1 Tax=Fusarium oxysporum NRRL 32931 TaxID=660029 RepID=W9HYP3_FUSOX|nr:hypothetical protein FOYG_11637 [Fusarium oxysporum NRRL 32931]